MNEKFMLNERPEQSVKALLSYLKRPIRDPHLRQLLIEDFFSKSENLPTQSYLLALAQVLEHFAPDEVKNLMSKANQNISMPPRVADVGIVTVVPEELAATKRLLGIEENQKEDRYSNGLRFWEVDIVVDGGAKHRVVLSMIGEARNTPCAVACSRFFANYDLGACLLVGIAAGVKEKTSLGDVYASEMVIDYEGYRLSSTGPKKRPTPFVPETAILRDYQYFISQHDLWSTEYLQMLHRNLTRSRRDSLPRSWRPNHDTGVVLAGEKLLDDGSLPDLREEFHDKVRAAEMEGSGFARACREYQIPWLVLRGISDFGDKNGAATRKKWKPIAATGAAATAVCFLKHGFRRTIEDEF